MGLFCSICKTEVSPGFSQCLACKAGYGPQLACLTCRKLVPRGNATCAACERSVALATSRSADVESTSPSREMTPFAMPAMPLPPPMALSIVAPRYAPSALPGLPSHIGLAVIPERYSAGKFGVTATVQAPALDTAIMNEMNQVVVVAHTLASHISASLMTDARPGDGATVQGIPVRVAETDMIVSPGPSRAEQMVEVVVTEMAQFVVILHQMAERMNHFAGFTESTRQLIREIRVLATDIQGEIEAWRMTHTWLPTASLRAVIRQCRVLATELQNEIETRRGPLG
jgi:hypothetical protein